MASVRGAGTAGLSTTDDIGARAVNLGEGYKETVVWGVLAFVFLASCHLAFTQFRTHEFFASDIPTRFALGHL